MKKIIFVLFSVFCLCLFSGCVKEEKKVDFFVENQYSWGREIYFKLYESNNYDWEYYLYLKKDGDNYFKIVHKGKWGYKTTEEIIDFYDLKIGNIIKQNDKIKSIIINDVKYFVK